MKNIPALITAILLLTLLCLYFNKFHPVYTQKDYSDLILLLKTHNYRAALAQELLPNGRAKIKLINQSGVIKEIVGQDLREPSMWPGTSLQNKYEQALTEGEARYAALFDDRTFLYYVTLDENQIPRNNKLLLSEYLPGIKPTKIGEQILNPPQYLSIGAYGITAYAFSPNGEYYVSLAGKGSLVPEIWKVNTNELDLTKANYQSPFVPTKNISRTVDEVIKEQFAEKISAVVEEDAYEVVWSLDGNCAFVRNFGDQGNANYGKSSIWVFNLETKQSYLVTNEFSNLLSPKIVAVISPEEAIIANSQGTFLWQTKNHPDIKRKILRPEIKLIGIIR